jgi:nitrous oxidase accessory protein NosD
MRFAVTTAVLLFGVLVAPAFADKLRVPKDFESIQEAVDAAQPGDTIEISGRHAESVTFNGKSDLTVIGKSGARIEPPDEESGFVLGECRDIDIRGLSFVGGDRGVHILFCLRIEVSKCRFDTGNAGVDARSSGGITVTRCRVDASNDEGITFGDDDGGEGVQGGEISRCNVRNTDNEGYRVIGSDIVVTRCTASNTGGDGFRLIDRTSERIRLERCRSTGSGNEAFRVNIPGSTLVKCVAVGAREEGYDVEADDCTVDRCKATRCRRGVEFEDCDRGTAIKCKVSRCSEDGFLIDNADDVRLEKCSSTRAGQHGVHIEVNSNGTTIVKSKAKGSGDFDLRDETGGGTTTIEKSKFKKVDNSD